MMSVPSAPSSPAGAVPAAASRKKKSARRTWIVIAAVLVVAAVVATVAVKNSKKEKPTGVTTEKAVVKNITHLVTATGKVQPETEVKISPEVSGEIIEIPFKEGQSVKKGDLLVKIKPDTYKFQVDQQEANLVSAKASATEAKSQLVKAEADFKRNQDLHGRQLLAESDYASAVATYESAQASYDSAMASISRVEGSLNQMRDQMSKTIIYAPADATISVLNSEIGERVVGTGTYSGTEIMRLADLQNMEVRVKVNENDIVNVKIGDHTVVTIDAFSGRKFDGTVSEIGNSAITSGSSSSTSDEVTNFLVKIRINDRSAQLRPGMSATVDIETDTVKDVVAVPIQSVTVRAEGGKTSQQLQEQRAQEAKNRTGNEIDLAKEREEARRTRDKLQRIVFVKDGDAVKVRKVETGISDNTHIEIKSGMKAGEEVVSGTYAAISRLLKDGSKVTVEKPKDEEKK